MEMEEDTSRKKRTLTYLEDTLRDMYEDVKETLIGHSHPELGSYIQILNALYLGGSLFLSTPVYLGYDEEKKRYAVKKCSNWQRSACIFVQVVFTFSCIQRISIPVRRVLTNKNDLVPIFDMVNELVINLFIYWHFYLHWHATHLLDRYVELIQRTPLLVFDRTTAWKGKAFPAAFWAMVLLMSVSWIRHIHGIQLGSWTGLVESGAVNARQIFWMDKNEPVSSFTAIFAVISRSFNCFFHHSILNQFTPTAILPVFFIGRDFYSAILREDIQVSKVLAYYEDYKKVIEKANDYNSTYYFYYVAMVSTFFSVHLFDTLNSKDLMWRLNMYMYDVDIWFILYIPTKVLLNGKKMKKWLWKDNNFMKVSKNKLALVLHDMIPWIPRKGIRAGRYLVISSEFAGTVLSNMWGYSLLVSLS